jgi:hypothetical protein
MKVIQIRSQKNLSHGTVLLKFFTILLFLDSVRTKLSERLFLIIRHQKKLDLILSTVKVLVMSIIFAIETMGPSLTSSVLDSSQKFTPGFIKNLKKLIKIFVVERLI